MEIFGEIIMWILAGLIWFNIIGFGIIVAFSVLGGILGLVRGRS